LKKYKIPFRKFQTFGKVRKKTTKPGYLKNFIHKNGWVGYRTHRKNSKDIKQLSESLELSER